MDKSETIELLQSENWTKADALRAIESIDFDTNPDELTIRRTISLQFVGSELIKRQRQQASQKSLLTKKNNEIEALVQKHQAEIALLTQQTKNGGDDSHGIELLQQQYSIVLEQRDLQIDRLSQQIIELESKSKSLIEVNKELKQDNKHLKNIVDAIRLRLAQDMKGLLKYEDSELRQAIMKLFKSTQG